MLRRDGAGPCSPWARCWVLPAGAGRGRSCRAAGQWVDTAVVLSGALGSPTSESEVQLRSSTPSAPGCRAGTCHVAQGRAGQHPRQSHPSHKHITRQAIKPAPSCSPATSSGPGLGCSHCWHCCLSALAAGGAEASCASSITHLQPCSHLRRGGCCGTSSPSSLAPGSCQGTAALPLGTCSWLLSHPQHPGHPAPPSSEAASCLAHRRGTRQHRHPETRPQAHRPLPHSTRTAGHRQPNPVPCCPENSSPAPNLQTLSPPTSPQRRKGTHRAEVPGCRCPHSLCCCWLWGGSLAGESALSGGCQSPASPFGSAPACTLTLPRGDLVQTCASSSRCPRIPLSPTPGHQRCRTTWGSAPRGLAGSWARAGGWRTHGTGRHRWARRSGTLARPVPGCTCRPVLAALCPALMPSRSSCPGTSLPAQPHGRARLPWVKGRG